MVTLYEFGYGEEDVYLYELDEGAGYASVDIPDDVVARYRLVVTELAELNETLDTYHQQSNERRREYEDAHRCTELLGGFNSGWHGNEPWHNDCWSVTDDNGDCLNADRHISEATLSEIEIAQLRQVTLESYRRSAPYSDDFAAKAGVTPQYATHLYQCPTTRVEGLADIVCDHGNTINLRQVRAAR